MKKYFLILLAAVLLMLISCNSEGIGIFYKISIEQPLSESALNEKCVYKIVSDVTDTYVLAGGAIYKENGTEWDKIPAPTGEIQAVSLGQLGTKIYSVYADDSNSSMYEMIFGATSWISATGSTIQDSNDLIISDSVNTSSYLFVCREIVVGNYEIYAYNGTTVQNITGTANITMPIISATYDGSDDHYLVSSNTTNLIGDAVIYTTDDNPALTDIDLVSVPGIASAIGSILYENTTLYAAGKDGTIYSSDESVGAGSLVWTSVNSTALDQLKLGPMEIVDIGGTDYLLIGSDGGFFEMELPSGTPVTPTSATIGATEYLSVDIYKEVVHTILSANSNTFFIGTSNGLWYSDTTELNLK